MTSIEGVVLSTTTNKPIPGAQVTAAKTPDLPAGRYAGGTQKFITVLRSGERPPMPPVVSTDANGWFVFQDLEPGQYILSAAADAYSRQEVGPRPIGQNGMSTFTTVASRQTVSGVVLRLTPAGTVTGRVTKDNGEPPDGFEVQLIRALYQVNGQRNLMSVGSAQANDRGEYRLFWMPPGRYYVSAHSQRYPRTFYPAATDLAGAASVDIEPGGELNGIDIHVTAPATYRIRGHVVDAASGQAPSNPVITLVPRDQVLNTMRRSDAQYNAADGRFEVSDVLPGSYWIRAQVPGGSGSVGRPGRILPTGLAAVAVSTGDVEGIELRIHPPSSISGKLRIEGTVDPSTLQQLRISLRSPVRGISSVPPVRPTRVREDGSFEFNEVGPGEYQLAIPNLVNTPLGIYIKDAHLGSMDVSDKPFIVSAPVQASFEILLATNGCDVGGTVINNQGEAAIGTLIVLLPDRRDRLSFYKFAVAGPNGQFTLRSVPPGSYTALAVEPADPTSLFDPANIAAIEGDGKRVTIAESSKVTLDLKVTPISFTR